MKFVLLTGIDMHTKNIKCIFTKNIDSYLPNFDLNDFSIYPEKTLSSFELFQNYHEKVVTTSPFLVGQYKKEDVLILNNNVLENPSFETFGASVEVLIKRLFDTRSSINNVAVQIIRENIKKCDDNLITQEELISFIEKLGESSERSYLKLKLSDKN